jgi:thiol-disulfide isomerase/thioredoxin
LDAESQLPTALGAGIEVLSHALDAKGERAGALEFLRGAHESYKGSSLETRIQKNVLLLSLKGQPFPSLNVEHYLGESTPVSSENLKGKVVVAFFWAHWCPDCKQQLPILEQLHTQYGDQELEYLQGAYHERFPIPTWMSVPVSHQNFLDFGVSTTPTLIIIDREGTVQLYNPGTLPYEELSAYVERLLAT